MAADTVTTGAQEAWMCWQREYADALEAATRSQQVLLEAVRFSAQYRHDTHGNLDAAPRRDRVEPPR